MGAVLLLGLACAGAGGDDTAMDTDSDAQDTGAPFVSPCPAYSGIQSPGTTWSWETTDAYFDQSEGRRRETLQVERIDGATVVISSSGSFESPYYDAYTWSGTTTYLCDDQGLWVVGSVTDLDFTQEGETTESHVEITYTTQPLLIPAGLQAGDSWSSVSEGVQTYSDSNGYDTESPVVSALEYSVHAADPVTVPAGTFDVLEVRTESGHVWFSASDAGRVMTPDYDHLLAWTP